MNSEHKDLQSTETRNQRQDPGACCGEDDGMANRAHAGKDRAVAMRPPGFSRPFFVIAGVALCMGLASCVVPYDSDGGGSVSVNRYSPGYRVTSLPGGYRRETISGSTYYYNDGYYYQPRSGAYVVVDAPRSSRYYDDYNRRQRIYQTNRDYQTSDRHEKPYNRSEAITRLPDGYRKVNHRGATYYRSGEQYYRRQGNTYVITASPF